VVGVVAAAARRVVLAVVMFSRESDPARRSRTVAVLIRSSLHPLRVHGMHQLRADLVVFRILLVEYRRALRRALHIFEM
jgi:hypothetical protein